MPPWQQRHPPPWQQPRMGGPPGMPPQIHPRGPSGPELNPAEIAKQESELEQEEKDVEAKIKQSEENLKRQYEVCLLLFCQNKATITAFSDGFILSEQVF